MFRAKSPKRANEARRILRQQTAFSRVGKDYPVTQVNFTSFIFAALHPNSQEAEHRAATCLDLKELHLQRKASEIQNRGIPKLEVSVAAAFPKVRPAQTEWARHERHDSPVLAPDMRSIKVNHQTYRLPRRPLDKPMLYPPKPDLDEAFSPRVAGTKTTASGPGKSLQ